MRSPDDKIDASMQAYAKRWMKSLNRPPASTTLGYFFIGLFILIWSSSITILLGFDLKKGLGTLIFIAVGLALSFATLLVVRLLARIGVDRPIRSAFLLSAVVGPYVGMVADHAWNSLVISHIAGFAASILAFLFSLLLDKLLGSNSHKPDGV